jgi:hypothetical protein
MVRGIYQTSDAGGRDWGVKFGLIGGVCWAIQSVGDRICSMPGYWNYATDTYTAHAKRALNEAGFAYASVKDAGDWPKGEYCDLSSVKIRKFIVTDLRAPDDSRSRRAEVFVKFDGKTMVVPLTTVQSYNPL